MSAFDKIMTVLAVTVAAASFLAIAGAVLRICWEIFRFGWTIFDDD